MNSIRATVSKVLTYSIVDGPGNRLVVFLQGCNFDCAAGGGKKFANFKLMTFD